MLKQKNVIILTPEYRYSQYKVSDDTFREEIIKKQFESRTSSSKNYEIIRYYHNPDNGKDWEINQLASEIDEGMPSIYGDVIFAKYKKGRLSNLKVKEVVSLNVKCLSKNAGMSINCVII